MKIHLIAAARPNFMKVAPLLHAMKRTDWINAKLVHTGQHYDHNMSDAILRDLGVPEPDFHLGVGSGSHAEQTGSVMIAYEKICLADRPDLIVVVGDVNSTAACAMVGSKLWIPVVHLEAGLRSNDRKMPEEINRLVTDAIADVLWTPSADADENLIAEGVAEARITMIGNIMIDSFEMLRPAIEAARAENRPDIGTNGFAVATLHRPSNVDNEQSLKPVLNALISASDRLPVVLVMHPRTKKSIEDFGFLQQVTDAGNLHLLPPLPYIQFMSMIVDASVVITDSGGLQEETTYLGIPCLTLRENTERPITVSLGTNRLVRADNLGENLDEALSGNWPKGERPALWDGKTAERAVEDLEQRFGGG